MESPYHTTSTSLASLARSQLNACICSHWGVPQPLTLFRGTSGGSSHRQLTPILLASWSHIEVRLAKAWARGFADSLPLPRPARLQTSERVTFDSLPFRNSENPHGLLPLGAFRASLIRLSSVSVICCALTEIRYIAKLMSAVHRTTCTCTRRGQTRNTSGRQRHRIRDAR